MLYPSFIQLEGKLRTVVAETPTNDNNLSLKTPFGAENGVRIQNFE